MRLEDYERKVFEDLFGLYVKGQDDNCPENHFTDALNVDFEISEWRTRPGITGVIFPGFGGNIRRFAYSPLFNVTLILDDQGNLYSYSTGSISTVPPNDATTPILTSAQTGGAKDFNIITMLGKIFIGLSDGNFGLFGINLKVYIPTTGEIRDAAGLPPTAASVVLPSGFVATPLIVTDGSGRINPGTYQVAVSFITSTGFVTPPGPLVPNSSGPFTPTVVVIPPPAGANTYKMVITNIPIGPPGTVGRQIFVTKANLATFFYVPSADQSPSLLNDNVLTQTIINFNDTTDLLNDATPLFSLLSAIPAPLALQDYNGRLVTAGEILNPTIIRVSDSGAAENFSATSGFKVISRDDGFQIKNMVVIRFTLYVIKNLGIWSVFDNGGDASAWNEATPVDRNVGTSVHGVAEFFSSDGLDMTRDWTLIMDRSGILLFDGIVRKPQVSNKINAIIKNINFFHFEKLQLVVDETLHKIYLIVPTGNSTECNTFLNGDYNLCPGKVPESTEVKWCPWQFIGCGIPTRRISSIGMFNWFPYDSIPTFKLATIDGPSKIWSLDPNSTTDDGGPIDSYWQSSAYFFETGFVHFFTASRLRVNGSGIITASIFGEDNVLTATLPSIILSTGTIPGVGGWIEEVITGPFNGINNTFPACFMNLMIGGTGFIQVYQNGLHLANGVDYNVNIAAGLVFMVNPPLAGDSLQFLYPMGFASGFIEEATSGPINGTNTVFFIVPPATNFVMIYQNGLALRQGVDYQLAGNQITMINGAPLTGDTLYFKCQTDNNYPPAPKVLDLTSQINGTSSIFNLGSTAPQNGFIAVYQNGLIARKQQDWQYDSADNFLDMANTPLVGDTLLCWFIPVPFTPGVGGGGGASLSHLGVEKLIRYNFQNEKAKIRFEVNGGKFIISKFEFFGKSVYQMRPM